jgi:hypothetical protein
MICDDLEELSGALDEQQGIVEALSEPVVGKIQEVDSLTQELDDPQQVVVERHLLQSLYPSTAACFVPPPAPH